MFVICRRDYLLWRKFADGDICWWGCLPTGMFADSDICQQGHLPTGNICILKRLPTWIFFPSLQNQKILNQQNSANVNMFAWHLYTQMFWELLFFTCHQSFWQPTSCWKQSPKNAFGFKGILVYGDFFFNFGIFFQKTISTLYGCPRSFTHNEPARARKLLKLFFF